MKSETKQITLAELLKAGDPAAIIKDLSFEAGLKLLEELVSKVEAGSLPLDQAIASYEKGAKVIEQLRSLLSGAEQKIKLLTPQS